jgi:hemerythrin
MFTWDDAMTTGIPNIDDQHKWLIAQFNKLLEAIQHGQGYQATAEILDSLQFYAEWHFGREESFMEHYACSAAGANKEAHQYFLSRFNALYVQYQTGTMSDEIITTVVQELGQWLMNHICQTDTHLNRCMLLHKMKEESQDKD